MTLRRLTVVIAAGVVASTLLATTSPATAADDVTVTTLHFRTVVGPGDDQVCDVVGDLYVPASATPDSPAPAILTTNGFGGSKDDQAGIGQEFAGRGYVVLSYSGLGFGGSDCKITLDDREFDGKAASQLIDYLGGAGGIAFTDDTHTTPAPNLDVVELDAPGDPRLGMVGGSYGGQVQYATAAIDDRLDTIVPIITWTDLSYSLSPNNTSQTTGVTTSTPGAAKLLWAGGFTALGLVAGLQNGPTDPSRLIGCPNFANWVCPGLVVAATTGTVDPSTRDLLRHASLTDFAEDVTIPTLILQGQSDTLFNLNEGVAAYRTLKDNGTPVKMVWINGGHSGPNAPGEIDFAAPDVGSQHVTRRVSDWFDHYLKGADTSTGPEFTYFRDWVDYSGSAAPAYASSPAYPVGTEQQWCLSDAQSLVSDCDAARESVQPFIAGLAGLPTSIDTLDVIGDAAPLPEVDVPGTFARWTSAPLESDLDVVGSPTLTLTVDAPTAALTQSLDPGKLVVFVKVAEVASDGSASTVRDLIAPVRVPDVNEPVTVTLPAFAHRFDAGSSLRLTVAGGSTNYRGGAVPVPVTIASGPDQRLTLPVVGGATTPAGPDTPDTDSPDSGGPDGTGPAAAPDTTDDTDDTARSASAPRALASGAGSGSGTSTAAALPGTGAPDGLLPAAVLAAWMVLAGAALLRHARRLT